MKIAPDKNKWNRIIMDADTVIVEFWKNVKSRIFCYVFMFVLDEDGATQQFVVFKVIIPVLF